MKSEITTNDDNDGTSNSVSSNNASSTKDLVPKVLVPEVSVNAYIAFGSNLNEPLLQLQNAYQALSESEEVQIIEASSLYRTAPVGGPEGQGDFLNAVVSIHTRLSAQQLLKVLHKIERAQGRERVIRWDARTLDLDLLSYKTLVLESKRLILPHPRMLERAFVMVPFCELAPDWVHPVSKETAKNSLSKLSKLDTEGIEKTDLAWF